MNIRFPFQVDHKGRTGLSADDEHIKEMIQQVLFTSPGERVNRPTFGSGLMQLVFQPNSPELAATTQFLVQGALQQWLGDLIKFTGVQVESVESTVTVTVQYVVLATQQRMSAEFTRGGG